MRTLRTVLTLLCVAALPMAAVAAPKLVAPLPVGKAEPVLKLIPAGTMGYVVINNLKTALENTDKFIADIGLGPMVQPMMPKGLLDGLKATIGLGETFTGDGGLAVVMLDPAQFDIDFAKLIKGGPGALDKVQLPYVVFVPGKGVKEVFPNFPSEPAGQYTKVNLPFGPMTAAQSGGYILLSPNEKAIAAVLKAAKKTTDELPEGHAKMLAASDLAIHVNMKVTGPVLDAVLKQLEAQFAAPAGGESGTRTSLIAPHFVPGPAVGESGPMRRAEIIPLAGLSKLFPMYRDMLKQVQACTVGLRIAKTGVVLEEVVDYVPDSMLAKMVAAYKPPAGPLVDRLPNLPYVLAAGQICSSVPDESLDMSMKALDFMMDTMTEGMGTKFKLDEATKGKIKKLAKDMGDQITEAQFVGGGAAEAGLFGVACVMKCKDAEKVKGLLADAATLANDTIKALLPNEPDVKGLNIAYAKGTETAGDVKLDAIEITHPQMAKMTERDRSEMTKVLGEDRIRFFVAAADKNTVVVTFGGTKPFMAAALKAAKEGGNIAKAEGVEEVMRQLPKDTMMVLLFSGGNLFDVIIKGCNIMGEKPPPFTITTKTPLAIGAGASGNSIRVVIYVPTDLVKEAVTGIMKAISPGGKPGTRPPLGGENF